MQHKKPDLVLFGEYNQERVLNKNKNMTPIKRSIAQVNRSVNDLVVPNNNDKLPE